MRIISGFHDYYDIGMQYGFDPKLPYYRRTKIIHGKPESFDMFFAVVGFAGKLYFAEKIEQEKINWFTAESYGFASILEPFQAFQELAMYVGNYMTQPVMQEPPLSDKTKAEIHGFDKFSFRKEKKKK